MWMILNNGKVSKRGLAYIGYTINRKGLRISPWEGHKRVGETSIEMTSMWDVSIVERVIDSLAKNEESTKKYLAKTEEAACYHTCKKPKVAHQKDEDSLSSFDTPVIAG